MKAVQRISKAIMSGIRAVVTGFRACFQPAGVGSTEEPLLEGVERHSKRRTTSTKRYQNKRRTYFASENAARSTQQEMSYNPFDDAKSGHSLPSSHSSFVPGPFGSPGTPLLGAASSYSRVQASSGLSPRPVALY